MPPSIPHRAPPHLAALPTAISCLGAFRTPSASPRDSLINAGVRKPCMGRLLSSLIFDPFPSPYSISSRASPRPDRAFGRGAQWRSRVAEWPIAKRLALDGHEHGGSLRRLGECTDDDNSEGSSRLGTETAPQPCIRSIGEDRNHDAVMRIGGEAPGRRAQSAQRLGGRGFYDGSPPPRIVIGRPSIGCQASYPVAPQLPLILMLVVTRRPAAPLLW